MGHLSDVIKCGLRSAQTCPPGFCLAVKRQKAYKTHGFMTCVVIIRQENSKCNAGRVNIL
ncbi:hypothetical protein D5282_06850 [bacterium 1xD8-48]|nr:hypothetical protein [bacterium 1xD8-48]